jgi:hypothetical protein
MMWFLKDPGRVDRERKAIAALGEAAQWLANVEWRIDTAVRLCVDAEILINETVFPVTLRYPDLFPHTPASVLPRADIPERWSEHQFGAGGELCLEHGPDNWVPELTGADLLVSAHRLLAGERPVDGVFPPLVPSRHSTTLGQALRWNWFRFIATRDLRDFVVTLPPGTLLPLTIRTVSQKRSFMAVVGAIRALPDSDWKDPNVPSDLGIGHPAALVRLPSGCPVPASTSCASVLEMVRGLGIDLRSQQPRPEFFLYVADDQLELLWLWEEAKDNVLRFETINATSERDARLSVEYRGLSAKRVALVGCGSAGSKVAVSLARSGIGAFTLIDDDVLVPENLVRNDLDWRDVGSHKVDALGSRIQLVNPAATIEARRIRLSGQEASGSAAAALDAISKGDLVIDATADPAVFNLLSSVVIAARKPLVWLEVFGGGLGGLVARYRPTIDLDPQSMRSGVLEWCARRKVRWPTGPRPYEVERPGGNPLLADDADVAAVAAHAARFAIDLLLESEPPVFPHSIYLIGLKRGWVFSQPFETFPIKIDAPIESLRHQNDSEEAQADTDFIKELAGKFADGSTRPE